MHSRSSHPHSPPTVAPPDWWEIDNCPACRTPLQMRPDEASVGLVFCDDCVERSRSLSEWDDLGVGD